MNDGSDNSEGAQVRFIGMLNTIYEKLSAEERSFLVELTRKATETREHAQVLQQQLVQTQLLLAVVVREHGLRSGDDARAVLRVSKAAFACVKGDLETWDEESHLVLSYKEGGTAEGPQPTPPADGEQRTPN
jgi:hypothetical protein